MKTDAKSLFLGLVKLHQCDLILDVGSCDGMQSLAFRDMMPEAAVAAIEANPLNFKDMAQNPLLGGRGISVHHLAVTDMDGVASFHIAPADYTKPFSNENNRGISSLLDHPGISKTTEVTVKASRLDTFIQTHFPKSKSIALWIDVESAEWLVLNGATMVWDKINVIHLETSTTPMRTGQRCLDEVKNLAEHHGLRFVGTDIPGNGHWGNVVFTHPNRPGVSTLAILSVQIAAKFYDVISINRLAVYLKRRLPSVYTPLRRLFLRGI